MHRAVDQVAGEHPVALVDQLGQLGQPIPGGQEALGLALDGGHGLGAEAGGQAALATITGGQAKTEHHRQAQTRQPLQLSGQGGGYSRAQCGQHGDRG